MRIPTHPLPHFFAKSRARRQTLVHAALVLGLMAGGAECEEGGGGGGGGGGITEQEGQVIYAKMVLGVSSLIGVSGEGPFDETEACPLGGSWRALGETLNSGADRGWDLDTTAEACGSGIIFAGEDDLVEVTMTGGPIAVFSPPAGDTTPASAEGSIGWSTPDGRSGTCTIFDALVEGELGGCE